MDSFYEKIKSVHSVFCRFYGGLVGQNYLISAEGQFFSSLNYADTLGIRMLLKSQIEIFVLAHKDDQLALRVCQHLGVTVIFEDDIGCLDFSKKTLKESGVMFLACDIGDYEFIRKYGVAVAPSDAQDKIIQNVDHICKNKLGEGFFREISDMLLKAQT